MNDIGPKDANVEIRSPAFHGVVGDAIPIERIATGFLFTEGPLWHAREKYLLFSDMPGDHMRKLSARGEVATFRKPCAQSNGLAWDRQGRLLVCEHATSKVTRTEADGSSTVIASHYAGKELNSPNDIVVKSDGSIYFSDPTYGRNEYYGNPRPLPRDFRGVYRAEPARTSSRYSLTISASRTGSASRAMRGGSSSTTPTANTSVSSTCAPTGRSQTAESGRRRRAKGLARRME